MNRPGFEGMQHVDLEVAHASCALLKPQEQGMARAVSNGAFIRRDVQIHQGFHVSTACPFCGLHDNMRRKLWE